MKFDAVLPKREDENKFVKLKQNECVKGFVSGDEITFYTHWINNRSQLCTYETGCEYCDNGEKRTFRFRVNFIVNENGLVSKILEQGYKMYCDLKNLQDSGYVLEETLLLIKRSGSGKKDTVYTVTPDPKQHLDENLIKKLKSVPILDLTPKKMENDIKEEKEKQNPFDEFEETPPLTENDVPF